MPRVSPTTSHAAVRPGGMSPGMQLPSEATVIKNAITYQNVNALQEELGKTALSHEAWQALLAYALEQKSSNAILGGLLRHPAYAPQFALEPAVQHNHIGIAAQALTQGADPEQINAPPVADAMRSLLTCIRRKNILYPPHIPQDQGTDLDRALRKMPDPNGMNELRSLVNQAFSERSVQEAWRDAVKNDQRDIQRAILLLHAEQKRDFRLLQEDPLTDEGVVKILKEIPYFSPKRGLLQCFNGQAMFSGKNEKITCRHLAEHRQGVQEKSGQLKFDDAQFANEKVIAATVSYDTEAKHYHLKAHAKEVRLFHNRDFGKMLVQQLEAMALKKETARLILLESTNHAMSVGLKIKEKNGKPRYVAELFDPDITTSHVRVASDNLQTLETLTLKNFINTEDTYKHYYRKLGELSIMFIRPSPQEEQVKANRGAGALENRTLTSCIADEEISPVAILYMLENGFAGDLRRLKTEIASRSEEEQIQLVAAKNADGAPAVFRALLNGHPDAIKAFGELLELVRPKDFAELLAAKNHDQDSFLPVVLYLGARHIDTIKAFGELLKWVPPEERSELLAAKFHTGVSGLGTALQNGRANVIKAFGALLEWVLPAERGELLAAKDAAGTPGLYRALQNEHADAIKAFGELLEQVPPAERGELLAAKDAAGVSGLAAALMNGRLEALEQYIDIVEKTAPSLNAQERAALLKDIRESHAVYMRGGHWINFPHYEALKRQNPDFYFRFEGMKNALESGPMRLSQR